MAGRIFSMIRKELIQVFRNRLTLQLILLSPLIQLLMFGYIVSFDVENVPTAVYDMSRSESSRSFISDLRGSRYFDVRMELEHADEIDRLLDTGAIDIVVAFPPDFEEQLAQGERTSIAAYIDATDSNTATSVSNYFNGIARDFIAAASRERLPSQFSHLANPALLVKSRVYFNPALKSIIYNVPGIVPILALMLLVMLSAISVVRERERGTLEQLTVTPIRTSELLIGKTVPFLLLGYVSMAIVTIVGVLWFKVPFRGSILFFAVVMGIFMFAVLGLGLQLSTVAQTQQQALMLSMFAIIPNILLSGFIFPIESMPEVLQWLTYVIPARYILTLVRGIFLKGAGLVDLLPSFIGLVVYTLVIFTVAALRFSRRDD